VGVFDLFKKKPEASEPAPPKAKEPTPPATEPPAEPQSLFGGLSSALKKTSDFLNTDIRDLFKREGRLVDDQFLKELFEILVKTDMGAGPAARIRDRIGSDFRARIVHMSDVLASVEDEVRAILQQPEEPIKFATSGPTVILVVGVNGSGKTTSIAKLTHLFRSQGKKVVLGAGDTFRAAAVSQLGIWADRLGAEIVKGENQGDPAAVAHKAVASALETGAEICIIDTAGRLQTQSNLMQQLEKIHRVITKQVPDAPHEVLLVLDATAGQNALSQAQGFSTAAKCTGIVLAKLDGSAKGGVIIPIREKFSIPVKFVGLGEKASDFAVFKADEFAKALFAGES
jgi:fused signal recognition particle receptor